MRNGFGIRAQQLHYREYSLRENTFDQDVYFLQTAFKIMDPSFILVSMLDRFELLPTLSGSSYDSGTSTYDHAQAVAILEEFLYLLVIVFSEPTVIESMDAEQIVRRELMHTLLLGPYSYSEVVKNVTERVAEETCFDRILGEVAIFRAPDPTVVTSDVGGVYTLRKECYGHLDPYSYRYNRNQREEAAKMLNAHDGNKRGFFTPRKVKLTGPFKEEDNFTKALTTDTFVEILRSSLDYATKSSDYAETVADLVLHLLNIAFVERPEEICVRVVRSALLVQLCQLEEEESTKDLNPRISSFLNSLSRHQYDEVAKHRKRQDPHGTDNSQGAAAQAEQKRLMAKARQANIMQQFAAASQTFLAEHDSSDEEDETESETEHDARLTEMMDDKYERAEEEVDDVSGVSATSLTGIKTKKRRKGAASMGSCIVCQEELTVQKPFGSLGLIQTSSFIRLAPDSLPYLEELYATPTDFDKSSENVRPFGLAAQLSSEQEGRGGTGPGFPRNTRKGLFASACGHMMHVPCFETYCSSILQRHSQQISRNHPENSERKEFICPLCKSLGNVLLPLSGEDFEDDNPPPAGMIGVTDEWLNAAIENCSLADESLAKTLPLLLRNGSGSLRAWRITENLPSHAASFGFASVSQAEKHMLERLIQVVYPLDAESRMLDPIPEERGSRIISHELIAYTISAIEIALRGRPTGTLNADSVPGSTAKLIRSLLSALDRLVILSTGTPRGVEFARLAILWVMFGQRTSSHNHQHFLNRDPFTVLVEAAAVAPNEFYQFATLTFYAHIIRTSYKLYQDNCYENVSMPSNCVDSMALADFCNSLQEERWTRMGANVTLSMRQRSRTAAERAYAHSLPFLRRAAILHNAIFTRFQPPLSEESEFTRLLSLLRIPGPRDIVGRRHGKSPHRTTSLSSIIETWDSTWLRPSHDYLKPIIHDKIFLEHPVIYELLGLPKNIDVLIESTIGRKCLKCRQVPSSPAICLLCGDVVCQQSLCCMDHESGEESNYGECNTHMWEYVLNTTA